MQTVNRALLSKYNKEVFYELLRKWVIAGNGRGNLLGRTRCIILIISLSTRDQGVMGLTKIKNKPINFTSDDREYLEEHND